MALGLVSVNTHSLLSVQLDCLLERSFPFLRPCWTPAVLRSLQNKAGEPPVGRVKALTLRNLTY